MRIFEDIIDNQEVSDVQSSQTENALDEMPLFDPSSFDCALVIEVASGIYNGFFDTEREDAFNHLMNIISDEYDITRMTLKEFNTLKRPFKDTHLVSTMGDYSYIIVIQAKIRQSVPEFMVKFGAYVFKYIGYNKGDNFGEVIFYRSNGEEYIQNQTRMSGKNSFPVKLWMSYSATLIRFISGLFSTQTLWEVITDLWVGDLTDEDREYSLPFDKKEKTPHYNEWDNLRKSTSEYIEKINNQFKSKKFKNN